MTIVLFVFTCYWSIDGRPHNGTPPQLVATAGLQQIPWKSPPTNRDGSKVDPAGQGSGCSFISNNLADKLQALNPDRLVPH